MYSAYFQRSGLTHETKSVKIFPLLRVQKNVLFQQESALLERGWRVLCFVRVKRFALTQLQRSELFILARVQRSAIQGISLGKCSHLA